MRRAFKPTKTVHAYLYEKSFSNWQVRQNSLNMWTKNLEEEGLQNRKTISLGMQTLAIAKCTLTKTDQGIKIKVLFLDCKGSYLYIWDSDFNTE